MSDHISQLDSTETPGDTELLLGKLSDAILLFYVRYIKQLLQNSFDILNNNYKIVSIY